MRLIKLKKGQAAMTDSLFFLTIIVALCVLLFRFSSVYGERIDLAVDNLYFKEYTNSTLKTIFYTDVPLDFSRDLENAREVDYLITSVKTDFLQNKKIGPDGSSINDWSDNDVRYIPKYNLFHTIKSLMHPIPNYDYIFYFENVNDEEFIYFMLKINESTNPNNDFPIFDRTIYYLCNPNTMSDVRRLVQNSNRIYSSSTPIIFKYRTVGTNEINGIANLTIWPSTTSINEEYITADENNLNCTEIII